MDYHDATSVLQVNYFLRHKSVLIKIASGRSRKMEHEPDFITALGQQRDEFVCSLWTFIAYLAMSLPNLFVALPRCGGLHRSAIAAVTPDGGSSWMAAEELEPL